MLGTIFPYVTGDANGRKQPQIPEPEYQMNPFVIALAAEL
jgi:hypothetical protein